MSILERRAYRRAEAATDFFLLNLLWLLACLPVVTAFPATAAMFGVARDWTRGRSVGVFWAFVGRFRQTFWQSLVLGVLWALFGGALALDFLVAGGLPGLAPVVARSLLVGVGVLYVLASVFLFPVLVHYDTKWTTVPKNALFLAVGRLPTTLACLLVLATAAALTVLAPPLILISGSVTAYAVFRLCHREFEKLG